MVRDDEMAECAWAVSLQHAYDSLDTPQPTHDNGDGEMQHQ